VLFIATAGGAYAQPWNPWDILRGPFEYIFGLLLALFLFAVFMAVVGLVIGVLFEFYGPVSVALAPFIRIARDRIIYAWEGINGRTQPFRSVSAVCFYCILSVECYALLATVGEFYRSPLRYDGIYVNQYSNQVLRFFSGGNGEHEKRIDGDKYRFIHFNDEAHVMIVALHGSGRFKLRRVGYSLRIADYHDNYQYNPISYLHLEETDNYVFIPAAGAAGINT
jgi:hypothetical protein